MPDGLAALEPQLWLWLIAMIRPGAAFVVAPVFGAASVPLQVRFVIALAIGIAGMHGVPFALPAGGVGSMAGAMLVAGEVLAGAAIGFAVQIGFASALVAGETIGNAMGLGFASMIDPTSGHGAPAIGQFLQVLGTFLFLAIGGHLMLATIIVDSYRALPPGGPMLGNREIGALMIAFGGQLFAAGLVIALPVAFALVIVQLVMAMLARTAPAMNLFAVGLPATILAGVILLAIAAPILGDGLLASLEAGLAMARNVAGG